MAENRILIVDDEGEFTRLLAERLDMRGIRAEVADSGPAALALVRARDFDAVILDMMMPEMDGLETLSRMREARPDLQVILLTGHATVEKGVEAIKLGAADFLEKPVDFEELLAKIKAATALRSHLLGKKSGKDLDDMRGAAGGAPGQAFKTVRASEVMIPIQRYPFATPECTLRDAIALFRDPLFDIRSRSGRLSLPRVLLVIEGGRDLVGMVRRRDILSGLEPGFLRSEPQDSRLRLFSVPGDPELAELSLGGLEAAMKRRADRPVRQIMQPIGPMADAGDHLFKIITEMVDSNVSLIPVLQNGVVVGVVRSVDVLYEVSKFILPS